MRISAQNLISRWPVTSPDLNVGVIEFSLNNNAPLIYPNPIDAHATLEYTLQNDETISIHLLDMQGKQYRR
ncbi:MAG: hypothetical protein IPH05_18860 [Flavobacteriales bacterium]|nr:hypothetical protein [Flavobacteriales bacterium]